MGNFILLKMALQDGSYAYFNWNNDHFDSIMSLPSGTVLTYNGKDYAIEMTIDKFFKFLQKHGMINHNRTIQVIGETD